MAGSNPTREMIQQVCEFGSVSEGDAVILLRKSNNNPERAIDAYFSDPVGSLTEEPSQREWQHQDNIPYDDDISNRGAPAMSRPPSPADNGKRFVDLSQMHADATASTTKSLKEQEDMFEMETQRAMAISRGQTLPEQEHGVTGGGQQFGPATGAYYNPSEWALAPVTTSREIIEHPIPSQRQRIPGVPVFLRGGSDTGYLPSLLTIYHSIPLAKEALLLPSMRVSNYGYDPSWWSGSTDENRKSLLMETSEDNNADRHNFLAEVQCLMAFLDGTERAYGCVDALNDLRLLQSYNAESHLSRFLQVWQDAALRQCQDEQLTQIFTSVAMQNQESMNGPITNKSLVCLEAPINRYEGQLLVDLLDNTVWNDTAETIDDVWIDQFAEVFTMRLFDPLREKQGLNFTTTAVWYPDRYMKDCKAITHNMRREIQTIRKEIDRYSLIQRRCQIVVDPERPQIKIRETLDAARKASNSVLNEKPALNGVHGDGQNFTSESLTKVDVQRLSAELQTILERIDRKVNALEQRKIELGLEMRKIALQLTQPSEDPTEPPFHKYVLQGVSTKPNITYVRRPREDLVYIDEDEEADQAQDWQWWRIWWPDNGSTEVSRPNMIGPITQAEAYNMKAHSGGNGVSHSERDGEIRNKNKSFSVNKVREQDVIEAAKFEHESVVLVYANENAMNFQNSNLNLALKHFVEKDNETFIRQVRAEQAEDGLLTPEEDNDDQFEQIPLNETSGQSSTGREMTPMSMASPRRDEDGQPSPKRPKSAEDHNSTLGSDKPPPSYEETIGTTEMQERKGNKIGLYAERMLERYGRGATEQVATDKGDAMHVEHPDELT